MIILHIKHHILSHPNFFEATCLQLHFNHFLIPKKKYLKFIPLKYQSFLESIYLNLLLFLFLFFYHHLLINVWSINLNLI
jgi:hypothetical protein